MARSLVGCSKLVVASHNPGKVREIRELLESYGIETVSASDLDLAEPEETETTFEGNARLKALASAKGSGLTALADDSGLAVDALAGEPGIYSARWAGVTKDFSAAMQLVEDKLQQAGATQGSRLRSAKFVCVLCLAWPDGHTETFYGEVAGTLTWPPRGSKGFGYDPMFVPTGFEETFGQMDPARKHDMSHRAEAFRLLMDQCLNTDAQAAR